MRVIAPSHVRRLEAGILSYGQDMDIENNRSRFDRLGWQVGLEQRKVHRKRGAGKNQG